MNSDGSSGYLHRLWKRVKNVVGERKGKRKSVHCRGKIERDCYQMNCKRPRMDIVDTPEHDCFDQTAFLEVMKKLLTCCVCLEVRKQANQCQNGHLICLNCTLCLQQSSTEKDINCPVCRIPLTNCYQRSLLAEQLVSELPTTCRFCCGTMSGKQLEQHEGELCLSRIINCKYTLFGCDWKGLAKQKRNHEMICKIGLSSIASAANLVQSNIKKQLNYYEKRNCQWNSVMTKLSERSKGFKMYMKHLVLSRKKYEPGVKSSFKTSKLEIFNHQFLLKFNIIKNKKTSSDMMDYKLIYMNKKKITMHFFLHSLRYDDEISEVDDNLHYHSFTEDENNAGEYNVYFSRKKYANLEYLTEIFSNKDSLYLEIVILLDIMELHDESSSLNSRHDGSDFINQDISTNRATLSNGNPGNLVVALISSNSLTTQPNERNEEESEDNDGGDQEEQGEDGEEEEEDVDIENNEEIEEAHGIED